MVGENKFTAGARIPTRPLSIENAHLAEKKELIADYEKPELYIKDSKGNIVKVTTSTTGDNINAKDIKTDNDHQFVTEVEKTAWNAKTDTVQLITKIFAGETKWTGSEAPYKQTINIEDIKGTDYPIVDIVLSEDYKTAMDELSNYASIYKILTFNGYIEVFAIKPTEVELKIIMKIDR